MGITFTQLQEKIFFIRKYIIDQGYTDILSWESTIYIANDESSIVINLFKSIPNQILEDGSIHTIRKEYIYDIDTMSGWIREQYIESWYDNLNHIHYKGTPEKIISK